MSNKTDIVIILDRSGSMEAIRDATVDGINNFIRDVQKESGDGYWTLVQFDDRDSAVGAKEDFPKVVFERLPDNCVPLLEPHDFQPRGGTALVDAVCKTIEVMKTIILSEPENERSRVMFVIVTDGRENQSTEYTSSKMRELIAEVESQYGWKTLYLGANQDAFAEAEKYGANTTFNYAGLAGVSGAVMSGSVAPGCMSNRSALPFSGNAYSVLETMASGAVGVRAWKADGNPTAEPLLTSFTPSSPMSGDFSMSKPIIASMIDPAKGVK